ncbi:MAG: diaminopimelate epimerase [Bacillota bacterium]|nr:diaminopimelate epimerase [Bacillota bacterium]
MQFTKMHGIGNDYIYFDCTKENPIVDPNRLSIKLSQYHFGVGADGIVMILPSDVADFKMRMFNADGSEGKMCGNATRCIGKFVYDRGLTDKTQLTLETLSGIKHLTLTLNNEKVSCVSVDMGIPEFESRKIPVLSDTEEFIAKEITVLGKTSEATCVSMGNPHCVIFTTAVDELPLEKIGPSYENNEIFPERVNTEFVEIIDNKTLKMRVWERGSGETFACGTGACAVVAAAVRSGISPRGKNITVLLRGGNLTIQYRHDNHIIMTGSANFVYDGNLLMED